jgi:hypothetical protein
VVQGAPVKVWGLTCGPCEDWLRSDPHWSPTISKIPETYDEKITREDFAERGQLDERRLMAMALAKLTGLRLPETLASLTGLPSGMIAGTVECEQGHENRAGSKFCAECGTVMREAEPTVVTCGNGHENAASAKFCAECGDPFGNAAVPALPAAPGATQEAPAAPQKRLRDMKADELRALARDGGLDDSGTRADLLARLQDAA